MKPSHHEHDPAGRAICRLLDGELTAEERAGLEARIAADETLAGEAEAFARIDALLENLPVPPMPDVRVAVLTRVAHARRGPLGWLLDRLDWQQWLPTAAWAAAGICAGLVLLPGPAATTAQVERAVEPSEIFLSMMMPEEVAMFSQYPGMGDEDPRP